MLKREAMLLANSAVDLRALRVLDRVVLENAVLLSPVGRCDPSALAGLNSEGVALRAVALKDIVTPNDVAVGRAAVRLLAQETSRCSRITAKAVALVCGADWPRLKHELVTFGSLSSAVSRALQTIAPRQVFATKEDPMHYRLVLEEARARGATTILVQHGIFVDDPLRGPVQVDHAWVWDSQSIQSLRDYWGCAKERPRFRVIPRSSSALPIDAPAASGRVLYATQPLKWRSRIYHAAAIIGAFNGQRDFRLTVKVHPKESLWLYEVLTRLLRVPGARVIRDADSSELIQESDVVLTVWSSIGHEARALRKPVICVHCLPGIPRVAFMDQCQIVRSSSELRQALRLANHDGTHRLQERSEIEGGGDRRIERDGSAQRLVSR